MIQKNWQALIKPYRLEVKEGLDPRHEGTIIAEPLERGFGLTLGNALRRVLLSSLQGSAITSVRFEGAVHEFSTLPGVREDIPEIILNLKSLAVKLSSSTSKKITLKADKEGRGELKSSIDLEVNAVSENAQKAIEKAKGKVTLITKKEISITQQSKSSEAEKKAKKGAKKEETIEE